MADKFKAPKLDYSIDKKTKRAKQDGQGNKDNIPEKKEKSFQMGFAIKLVLGLMAVLVAVYLASVFYFSSHFSWVTAEDESLFNMTESEVKALLQERVADYFIAIETKEMEPVYIAAADIGLKCTFSGDFKEAFRQQDAWVWPKYYFNPIQIQLPIEISYDEESLEELMNAGIFSKSKRDPRDAAFVEDTENCNYYIEPEAEGTVLEREKTLKVVGDAVVNLDDSVNLQNRNCYRMAQVTALDLMKDPRIKSLTDLCKIKIDVDWHGIPVVIDHTVLFPMIETDDTHGWIEYEPVLNYVKNLSRKYDLFGQTHHFVTTEGHEVDIEQGAYGWRVDRDATAEAIFELIQKGGESKYEPVYRYCGFARGEDDIGPSYAEINLTTQHLYLYHEGKVVVESDFVSGNTSRGNGTHVGVYGVTYKERDATLKGQGYSSPVSYWMPFNGNEGMHDASWRDKFGGRIYKTNGSHGCINLPVEAAREIYEYVEKGFPCVVFYDPESAEYEPEPVVEDKPEEKNETGAEVTPEANAEEKPETSDPANTGDANGAEPQVGAETTDTQQDGIDVTVTN